MWDYINSKLEAAAGRNLERARPREDEEAPSGFSPLRMVGSGLDARQVWQFAEMYRSTAYACINKLSWGIARLDWRQYVRRGQDERELLDYDHELTRLFRRPTPFRNVTTSIVFRWLQMYLEGTGEAVLWTPLDRREEFPAGLYALPPQAAEERFDGRGFVSSYWLTLADGQRREVPAYEVCKLFVPGPEEDVVEMYTRGFAPVQAAIDDLQADQSIKQWLRESLDSYMLPPWFMKVKGKIDPKAKEVFKAELKQSAERRKSNRYPMGFIGEDWDPIPLELFKNQKDSQLLALPFFKATCWTLDVPPGLLDSSQMQNKAVADALLYWFQVNSIEPRGWYMAEALTQHFEQFEKGLEVDFERVDRQDAEAARAAEQFLIDNGLATRNQIAQSRGLPEIPNEAGGDEYFLRSGLVTVRSVLSGTAGAPDTAGESAAGGAGVIAEGSRLSLGRSPHRNGRRQEEPPLPFEFAAGSEELGGSSDRERALYSYWKKYDTPAEAASEEIASAISGVLLEVRDRILRALEREEERSRRERSETILGGFDPSTLVDISVAVERRYEGIVEVLDPVVVGAALVEASDPALRKLVLGTYKAAVTEVGANYDDLESQFDTNVRRTLKRSTSKISEASDTIKRELSALLAQNYERPKEELAQLITDRFEHYSEARARTIGRTTATFATSSSQLEAWTELGVRYVWLSQRDSRVRESHVRADGQKPDEEGNFRIGSDRMKHPAAGQLAAENVNCRCVLRARGFTDDEETAPTPAFRPEPGQTPPAPRPDRFLPAGKATSQAIRTNSGKARTYADEAFTAIDSIHGDGDLETIPILARKMKEGHGGSYRLFTDGSAEILVSNVGPNPALTLIHEVGHWLDNKALGVGGRYGSVSAGSDVAAIVDLARDTASIKYFDDVIASGRIEVEVAGQAAEVVVGRQFFEYLRSSEEIWARAYAQYIATRTGDEALLAGIRAHRAGAAMDSRGAISVPMQWSDEEFEPIAEAIDRMMINRGWRVPEP